MSKYLIILILNIFFVSCNKNSEIKKISQDIVNSNLDEIDSIFNKYRPVTSFYLDSVIVNKPSVYFKNSDFFFKTKYYLYIEGGNYSKDYLEYYIDYRNDKEGKMIQFTFTKKDEWKLVNVVLLKD